MANANLFETVKRALPPAADTLNLVAAPVYRPTPKHRLAQYAATGCLNDTFHAAAEHLFGSDRRQRRRLRRRAAAPDHRVGEIEAVTI